MSLIRRIFGSVESPTEPVSDVDQFKKISYSQTGEDILVDFIFQQLKIGLPTYLDIGAHHPYSLSNTYFFYQKGCRGVNVEPDPLLHAAFPGVRNNDVNLNIGIGFKEEDELCDFYVMSAKSLNTFSKEDAGRSESFGTHKITEVIKINLVSINKIIEKHFPSACPNFISLDVEGLDFDIIKSFDFERFRPEVFCIETLTYSEDNTEEKIDVIAEFMSSKGYKVFADTYINTVFVDEVKWRSR